MSLGYFTPLKTKETVHSGGMLRPGQTGKLSKALIKKESKQGQTNPEVIAS